jgi:hypothetical protein
MPRRSRSPAAMLLIAVLLPAPLPGQSPATAKPGAPIRFAGGCGEPTCPVTRGSLVGTTESSVTVRVDGLLLDLARSDLQTLEVGHNRHGARTGAIIGAGVLGLGTMALAVTVCAIDPWDDDGCPAGAVAGFTLASAAVGAGIGALIGALVAPMQWRPVSPSALRTAIVPLPGARVGVGLSMPLAAPRVGARRASSP